MFVCAVAFFSMQFASAWGQGHGEAIAELSRTYCIDCHQGWGRKGDVSLGMTAEHFRAYKPALLKSIRDQLRSRNMPPVESDLDAEELANSRPTTEEYDAAIRDLGALLSERARGAGIPEVVLRRLNRVEYANAIRQLTGVEVDVSLLPSDDVGQAFDHLGEVLSMSPLLFEKSMNLAEATARRAIIDPDAPDPDQFSFGPGKLRGAHGNRGGAAWRNSVGEIFVYYDVLRAGRYRAEFTLAGRQAGPDPVRFALRMNNRELDRVEVPESTDAPSTHVMEFQSDVDSVRIGAAFLNDYYRPKIEDPRQRDRNAAVLEIQIFGPIGPGEPTDFQRSLEAQASRSTHRTNIARAARWLLQQAWRRPVSGEEALRISDIVSESVDPGNGLASRLRSLLVYALVSPEFLFRLERTRSDIEPSADGSIPLDGYSLATRLTSFLFASVPDRDMLQRVRSKKFLGTRELRKEVRRMLEDPRSRALAERFATQWLRVDGVERLEPDPAIFGLVDEATLRDMREETVRVFDDVLREEEPIWELFEGSRTYLTPRLARHYGIPEESLGNQGSGFRKVDLNELAPERAGLGVLGHASVLASTSNSTRTSPVKRGKWVMEALLDTPPPPAPPGVPQLPSREESHDVVSLRMMLERHRADPDCAVCHLRMDAFGLALESMDAVGRVRDLDGDVAVDDSTTLPDGTQINGPFGLGEMLVGNRDVLRSLSRHMLVYALGRGLDWRDEPLLDFLVETLVVEPKLSRLVEEIVLSRQFRMVSIPQEVNVDSEGLPMGNEVDTVGRKSSGTAP